MHYALHKKLEIGDAELSVTNFFLRNINIFDKPKKINE